MADEFPTVDVLILKPLAERNLWLRFGDGREGVADLGKMVESRGPMVQPLRDDACFARVFVEMGAPTWSNGFDLDPTNLYRRMVRWAVAEGSPMRKPRSNRNAALTSRASGL